MLKKQVSVSSSVKAALPRSSARLPVGQHPTVVFQQVLFSHLDAAYTLARYLTRRGDLAEDLVQEAFLRACCSFETYRGGSPRAWLLASVRNCFLSWQERDCASSTEGKGTGQCGSPLPGETTDTEFANSERMQPVSAGNGEGPSVRTLIEQLPHRFREVLVLCDIQDMSYREIAEITGVPIGTVMSRLARARRMLAASRKGMDTASEKEKAQ